MPAYKSVHWNLSYDVCEKHQSPLPCSVCINTEDKDLIVISEDETKPKNFYDLIKMDVAQSDV